MINHEDLHLVVLNYEGLQTLVQWADAEGWNPGPNDAQLYWQTDPKGFYGYYHKNELIAGGSLVSYDGEFGFMGFFIVKPEYRSSGIGHKLWYERRNKLISRLKANASIGMDGVLAMQSFYKKGGFEIAFRDERHEKIGSSFDIDPNVSEIVQDDWSEILKYDSECFGFLRPQFLLPWLQQKGIISFKYATNDSLKGFVIVRPANSGFKICPLFADSAPIAEELYKACLNALPGKALYLDIPIANNEAVNLVKKYNTTYVFECARMYYGKAPELPIHKIFGITTFELG